MTRAKRARAWRNKIPIISEIANCIRQRQRHTRLLRNCLRGVRLVTPLCLRSMSTEELDRLLDKATSARVHGRHALAATVWGSAAAAARACYGGETLASVLPCLYQIKKLVLLAQEEKVTAKEVASLRAEALSVFSGLLPYLVRRLDEASLLPGSCTKVEEDWYRRYEVSKRASNGWLPPAPHTLKLIGQGVGYASLIMAAEQALVCLYSPTRPPPEQSEAFQSLVLRTLDIMIPASKTLAIDSLTLGEEKTFAFCLSQTLVRSIEPCRHARFFATDARPGGCALQRCRPSTCFARSCWRSGRLRIWWRCAASATCSPSPPTRSGRARSRDSGSPRPIAG